MGVVVSFERVTDDQIRELLTAADKRAVYDRIFPPDRHFSEADTGYLDKSWDALHYLLNGTTEVSAAPLSFIKGGKRDQWVQGGGIEFMQAFFSAEVSAIAAALADLSVAELRARFTPAMMGELALAEVYSEDFWSATPRSRLVTETRADGRTYGTKLPQRPPLGPADWEHINQYHPSWQSYLIHYYESLRAFVTRTAEQGMGMLSSIG